MSDVNVSCINIKRRRININSDHLQWRKKNVLKVIFRAQSIFLSLLLIYSIARKHLSEGVEPFIVKVM